MGLPNTLCVLIREDWEPTELKHLSRWRKRKQYAISLVTASETDIEQTESRLVICVEMWCYRLTFGLLWVNRILFGILEP